MKVEHTTKSKIVDATITLTIEEMELILELLSLSSKGYPLYKQFEKLLEGDDIDLD
jgi:hypothetical protein